MFVDILKKVINISKMFPKYEVMDDYHWNGYKNNLSYKALVDYTISHFPKTDKNETLLDIGCGDGLYSHLLWSKGYNVIGVDSSDKGISIAKRKTKNNTDIKFYVVDLEFISRYKLKDFKFDYALCSFVIEHIKPEIIVEIFEKYISKYMILSTDSPKRGSIGRFHRQLFSVEDLKKLFVNNEIELLKEESNKYIVKIIKKGLFT